MNYQEYRLQVEVCRYLSLKYKNVMFLSDTIANIKLTKPQAVRNKKIQKSGFKCPDIIILEPRGEYNGLFIELKTKSPYKLNGELYKNEHLEGQAKSMKLLRGKGYYATFAWSLSMAIDIIDKYMNQ